MGLDSNTDAKWANLIQGELVVRTLLALGVDHFFISPGSRSSPLALAVEGVGDTFYTVVLDERSAAFMALGYIKATGKPAALICTSGTAGAHYYPAVIEARETALPLVVLTADRPPELRSCHAGQTIDQVKLYSDYPVFQTELPLPEADDLHLRQVREICRVAVESSRGLPGGPVHLNCPYREPFFPRDGCQPELDTVLLEGVYPVTKVQCRCTSEPRLPERTVILAGPAPAICHPNDVNAILELADRFGWPILADAASPLRHAAGNNSPVIVHYDRIARDAPSWERLKPDATLHWGEPPTSKELRARLADTDVPGYLVSNGKRAINPSFGKLQWACSNPADFAAVCEGKNGGYADEWLAMDRRIEHLLEDAMDRPHPLFEGDIMRFLGRQLPPSAAVFLASSLAIRDAEWFLPSNSKQFLPFSQRGANGIDGTLSLARGVAKGLRQPVYLVAGDLAFLHDANGMSGAAAETAGLFVVLVNNRGGGIFEFLPVAGKSDRFEELFAAPQAVDHRLLVEAHDGHHKLHDSLASLESHLNSWNGKGLEVAEILTDRGLTRELHRKYLFLKNTYKDES